MINGDDLIKLGYKPNKNFRKAIDHINLNNLTGNDIIKYMDSIQPIQVEPYKIPKPFKINIRPENEIEKLNIENVIDTMQTIMTTPTVVDGCIMPDACPTGAGQMPVGSVIVTKNAIHPAMHSADICCSVMMTNFGKVEPKKLLDFAHAVTHFGYVDRKEIPDLPKDLKEKLLNNQYTNLVKSINFAKNHLGTQGDGNHFLFVGKSKKTGDTIMVTHHGSRGLGANLYKKGMEVAEYFRKEISPNTNSKNAWIPYDTDEGKRYWEALQLVREWTKLNHQIIHNKTADKIGKEVIDNYWNEHNFVFKDEDLFYHAKGATPLESKFVPDNKSGLRLIPLNMGEPVLVVRGKRTDNNLGFAPHGAGRNISRGQHFKNKYGRTNEEIFAEETKGFDVRFYSKNIDISELPSAYKNAEMVKRQMKEFELGEVVDEIMPYGCIMAGNWELDAPWKRGKG